MTRMQKDKILITGATGFIGSFIVEEALRRGMEVWAAVRATSSRKYLPQEGINFIELDFNDEHKLKEQLRQHSFDYVVHAAGVTKCLNKADFFKTNSKGTRHLVNAILDLAMPVKRFVFISSLSILGPIREEEPHTDITDSDTPCPNTAYGKSKLEAEDYLRSVADRLPFIILRPTGVYGPREKDYFMMAESIKKHVDFAVGYKRQDITFIFVSDVVQAVFLALTNGKTGSSYILSDGEVYSSRTFSDLIQKELGVKHVLRIVAPLWFLKTVSTVAEAMAHLTGKISALNRDKYNIMKQRNWQCDISPARKELGFEPKCQLPEGVRISMKWYKDNGWM
ncbi:NAD(P)-dependent oxidoreductase [uncultured Prevotella sp.]|mgnify:FL=1|uniref:NAD-dependent epimerase/dehydratase family protein n=1 Tax=uncultured Prevotella sp. TaxID=159272 RepID=UPI002670FFB5|nr:NAD-dependent epimerase/dehydratase family protein [uncultured Prevotella sp.]